LRHGVLGPAFNTFAYCFGFKTREAVTKLAHGLVAPASLEPYRNRPVGDRVGQRPDAGQHLWAESREVSNLLAWSLAAAVSAAAAETGVDHSPQKLSAILIALEDGIE